MKSVVRVSILVGSSVLVLSSYALAATWNYTGKGGYRPDQGDGYALYHVSIDQCKNKCESEKPCKGIEYISNPDGWDEPNVGFVREKCEIHRETFTHCDTSFTGGKGASDGCWVKLDLDYYEMIDGEHKPPTQLNGMHTCPKGYAVTGVHVDKNLLLCKALIASGIAVNPPRQDWGISATNQYPFDNTTMHWCGAGQVVTGVHAANNGFNCSTLTDNYGNTQYHLEQPIIDGRTVRGGMHACP